MGRCIDMRKPNILLATFVVVLAFTATARNKGDVDQGKKTFEQCAICHNSDTDDKKVGPSLKGLFQRKKLNNGKSVSDENVLTMINSGGGGMPSFADKLSQEEKDNLLAYLHSL
jgi:cytochrome c